jgi:hypothetical protein
MLEARARLRKYLSFAQKLATKNLTPTQIVQGRCVQLLASPMNAIVRRERSAQNAQQAQQQKEGAEE